MIYAVGSNACGQLGIGSLDDSSLWVECIKSNKIKIAQMSGGANHSLLVTEEGSLFGTGSNDNGQLGLSQDQLHQFQEIPTTTNIVQVATGWHHSLALDVHGQVWAFGNNQYGQLGLTTSIKDARSPVQIPIPMRVSKIACGLYHSVALDEHGIAWGWGLNKHGELGKRSDQGRIQIKAPQRILQDFQVTQISTGQHHTLLLTHQNLLLSMGWNKFGQLGCLDTLKASDTPMSVHNALFGNEKILQTFCGWTFSGCLTLGGHVYVWGRCDRGQLGLPLSEIQSMSSAGFDKTLTIPVCRIPVYNHHLKDICQVSVGSEHGLALDQRGRVFSWGWNEHGNLGLGHQNDVMIPTEMDPMAEREPIQIACGYGHSFVQMKIIT